MVPTLHLNLVTKEILNLSLKLYYAHLNTFVQSYDIASEALTTLKRSITCINRCECSCFNRYRPKHFCLRTLFAPVRHSPTNNLCIAPLIFEHRKFSGNSFNFSNFRFLKKTLVFFNFLNILPLFPKCTKGYIWSLYVHCVHLLIY